MCAMVSALGLQRCSIWLIFVLMYMALWKTSAHAALLLYIHNNIDYVLLLLPRLGHY